MPYFSFAITTEGFNIIIIIEGSSGEIALINMTTLLGILTKDDIVKSFHYIITN